MRCIAKYGSFKEAQEQVAWHLHKSTYHQMEWPAALLLAKEWVRSGTEEEWPEHPGFKGEHTKRERSPADRSPTPPPGSTGRRSEKRRTDDRDKRSRGGERRRDDSRRSRSRRRPLRSPSPPRSRVLALPATKGTKATRAAAALATPPPEERLSRSQELQMALFVCDPCKGRNDNCPLPKCARPPARASRPGQLAPPVRSLVRPPVRRTARPPVGQMSLELLLGRKRR